ncbi:MAG: DNA-binding response regulator, partial [Bacteroidota bacterium]
TVAEPFAMPDPVIETPRVETQQSLSLSDFEKNLVLIVEDNPEVLHFVRSILETDYRVAIARDGAEGERLALELIPDLIVSDVGMPVMDGFQLTERLKQDERTSHIPVVLLTARAEEKDRLQGLSFGADAYLTKPFRQAELKVRIEKLIEVREKLRLRFAGLPAEESSKPPSREEIFLQQIKDIILGNLLNPELNPDLLAEKMNMSYTQLYRKLKALTNQSANLLIREVRLEKAAEMLQQSDEGIAEIAYACGFNDPAYFSRAFSTKYGMPPSLYRDSR